MTVDLSEGVQRLILETLDRESIIEDTTKLNLHGQSTLDQQMVLGVLKRLAAHEVLYHYWRGRINMLLRVPLDGGV